MTTRGADQPEVRGNPDILESGPERLSRPPRRIGVGFALVLLVAAALAGYLVGDRHHAGTATPDGPPPVTAPADVQPIVETGKRCSAQLKDRLQLGIEVVNQSATALTLRQVQAVLPLPGLRAAATAWGSCGQLSPAAGADGQPLPAGTTAWLTVTFEVLVPCPGSIPVRFTVHYLQSSGPGTVDLPGFRDLGGVPYTSAKCPAGSS